MILDIADASNSFYMIVVVQFCTDNKIKKTRLHTNIKNYMVHSIDLLNKASKYFIHYTYIIHTGMHSQPTISTPLIWLEVGVNILGYNKHN